MKSLVPVDIRALDMREGYRILSGLIIPRPIAFVSTLGSNGVANLAPFSFFMAGGSNPPSLCFSPTPSRTGDKDTLRNIRESGEFVIHLVDTPMLEGMNASSASLGPEDSEWPLTSFHQVPARLVKPPLVQEAPAAFECKLHQIVEHGEGVGGARYVIGEVVFAHLRSDVWDGQTLDVSGLSMLGRLGGSGYVSIDPSMFFDVDRPA